MKIGDLVYESDGITIVYEEKELINDTPSEITLNKLGEPDTVLTVIVTAEDGVNKNEYQIVIKRPYGILKGEVYVSPTASKGIHRATIRVYSRQVVNEIIDWNTVSEDALDDLHSKLLTLDSNNVDTNDDGTFEIYVIPGTYDVLIDKPGYLDHICTGKIVQSNTEIDLGKKDLIPGDINKDGCVQLQDLSMLMNVYGIDSTSENYDIMYDFNEDSQVQLQDMSLISSNYSEIRKVEK